MLILYHEFAGPRNFLRMHVPDDCQSDRAKPEFRLATTLPDVDVRRLMALVTEEVETESPQNLAPTGRRKESERAAARVPSSRMFRRTRIRCWSTFALKHRYTRSIVEPIWSQKGDSTMPVNLSIKNVPEELAGRLRERARRNHRSLQGELRAMLEEHLGAAGSVSADEAWRVIQALGLKTPAEAARMIRSDRDARARR